MMIRWLRRLWLWLRGYKTITAGVDVGVDKSYYSVLAWKANGATMLVDYGEVPGLRAINSETIFYDGLVADYKENWPTLGELQRDLKKALAEQAGRE